MKAKNLGFVLTVAAAAIVGWFAARHTTSAAMTVPTAGAVAPNKVVYQCPMHPWIKAEQPAKCTICGMDLVAAHEGGQGAATDDRLVTLTPATATVIGVQTAEVRSAPLVRTLRVSGVLLEDETRRHVISASTDVRVEKLYVNQVGQRFAAGDRIAAVFSPELLAASQLYANYAVLLKSAPDRGRQLATARDNLRRFGLSDMQIDALGHMAPTDILPREVDLAAPVGGAVLERNAYEGAYVRAGDPLISYADLSSLWFVFNAYEADLPWLRVGQMVEVSLPSRPGEIFRAPIAFIDPALAPESRTARVRVVIDNADHKLFARQTAFGRVRIELPGTLLAPRLAVLFTQAEPLVYVAHGDTEFEPRVVKLGQAGDDAYEVLAGLQAGERVVTQAALILDGQAQLTHAAAPAMAMPAAMSDRPDAPAAAMVMPAVMTDRPAAAAPAMAMPAMMTDRHDAPAPAMAMPVAMTDHQAAAAPAMAMSDSHEAPAAAQPAAGVEALRLLALAAADAAAALGDDDLGRYATTLPAIHAAFEAYAKAVPNARNTPLARQTADLKPGLDLKTVRAPFEVFSTSVADLARNAGLQRSGAMKIYQCGMSPVLGKGRWLQRGGKLRNPFYGSAMPDCGEEVK